MPPAPQALKVAVWEAWSGACTSASRRSCTCFTRLRWCWFTKPGTPPTMYGTLSRIWYRTFHAVSLRTTGCDIVGGGRWGVVGSDLQSAGGLDGGFCDTASGAERPQALPHHIVVMLRNSLWWMLRSRVDAVLPPSPAGPNTLFGRSGTVGRHHLVAEGLIITGSSRRALCERWCR